MPELLELADIRLRGAVAEKIRWNQSRLNSGAARYVYAFFIYMSTSASGPFTKMNGSPIKAGLTPQWTQGGLADNQTYYFQVSALDHSGNESGQSISASVTPSP